MRENFGTRFERASILAEFFRFCEENNYNYQDMWKELERSKREIREKHGQTVVYRIEARLREYEECPRCENNLLYNSKDNQKYCTVCEDIL